MEEYNPTLSEHPPEAKQYDHSRPHSRRRLWNLSLGTMFQTWPDYPLQIVRYGRYYLRWELKEEKGFYRKIMTSHPQISINGNDWLDWDEVAADPNYYKNKNYKTPAWFNKDEFEAEVDNKYKEFTRKRSRLLAKRRREKLKQEAEKAGMDFAEYKAQKTAKNKKERKAKKIARTGQKMADTLERKMKLAMALKDLHDETTSLRTRLEDENEDLNLAYIDNKLDKIQTATWVLRAIGSDGK